MTKDLGFYEEQLNIYKAKLKTAKTDYEKWDINNQIRYIKKVIKEFKAAE